MSIQTQANSSTEAFYLVKMIVKADGYNKEAVTVVNARCTTEAKASALLGEAHNELIDNGDGWFTEDDGSFAYFAKEPIKLSDNEAAVFIKHGI